MADNNNNVNGNNNYTSNPNLPNIPADIKGKNIKPDGRKDKPTLKNKIKKLLFSEKLDSMGNYLFYYIFGPSLKNLVWNLGSGALQMALFGNGQAPSPPSNTGTYVPGYGYRGASIDPVPYNNLSRPGYGMPGYGYANVQGGQYAAQPAVAIATYNDVSFTTKDEAWAVLDIMGRTLAQYGKVKVADFYSASGITGQESNWTLQGTGWTNLSTAQPIMRTDGRWMINFPPVQVL